MDSITYGPPAKLQDGLSLPHDPEAEKWTIGAMLVDPSVCGDVFDTVKPDDFLDELAQAAAWSIHRAWRAGTAVEPKLVVRDMRGTGGDVGEYADLYLGEVAQTIPTASNADHYARLVAEAARKRRLLEIGSRVASDAASGRAASEVLAEALESVSGLSEQHGPCGDPWRRWVESLDERNRPTHFEIADPNSQLNRLSIGPGLFTLIGAPPGMGKTALAVQVVVDALLADESLKAVIANVEMEPGVILDRQLARLSEVSYSAVRDRVFYGSAAEAVRQGGEILLSLAPRLTFMAPPFTTPRLQAIARAKGADIVVADYLQRFQPSTAAADQRQQVGDVMSDCRELAMGGPAVIGVSAMSRTGQFRESSELEYGCDTGFILERPEDAIGEGDLIAKCIKNRHGAVEDIELSFDGRYQKHTAAPIVDDNAYLAAFAGESTA